MTPERCIVANQAHLAGAMRNRWGLYIVVQAIVGSANSFTEAWSFVLRIEKGTLLDLPAEYDKMACAGLTRMMMVRRRGTFWATNQEGCAF